MSLKVGDLVRVVAVPPDVTRLPKKTREAFRYAVGKVFQIEGFDGFRNIELVVRERRPARDKYESETIWITAEFVVAVKKTCCCAPVS
jgi:hypothetical protein